MDMTFFTEERLLEFWGYVRSMLLSVSPMVMLMVALTAVSLLLVIVVRIFKQANRKDDKDDDDEFEIRHY